MKALKNLPNLVQGDLLLVNLTGSSMQYLKVEPPKGRGWLCVTEISTDGEVISANFCPEGGRGFGSVAWPKFECYAFLRGTHGDTSPFAAIMGVFNSKCAAVALT